MCVYICIYANSYTHSRSLSHTHTHHTRTTRAHTHTHTRYTFVRMTETDAEGSKRNTIRSIWTSHVSHEWVMSLTYNPPRMTKLKNELLSHMNESCEMTHPSIYVEDDASQCLDRYLSSHESCEMTHPSIPILYTWKMTRLNVLMQHDLRLTDVTWLMTLRYVTWLIPHPCD